LGSFSNLNSDYHQSLSIITGIASGCLFNSAQFHALIRADERLDGKIAWSDTVQELWYQHRADLTILDDLHSDKISPGIALAAAGPSGSCNSKPLMFSSIFVEKMPIRTSLKRHMSGGSA
jgi:hypothetical protein